MFYCFPVSALDAKSGTLPRDVGDYLNVHSMGSGINFPGCITLPSSSPMDGCDRF